jgi:hypothetical protein
LRSGLLGDLGRNLRWGCLGFSRLRRSGTHHDNTATRLFCGRFDPCRLLSGKALSFGLLSRKALSLGLLGRKTLGLGLLADLVLFSPVESWLRRSRGLER